MAGVTGKGNTRKLPAERRGRFVRLLRRAVRNRLNTRTSRFIGAFALLGLVIGVVFGTVHLFVAQDADAAAVSGALWTTYGLLMLVAGAACWLLVDAAERRRSAQVASRRQASKLSREARDRERQDSELREARDNAEAANQAKSRYMAGLSHELRSPLNTILGYAQILEDDQRPAHRRAESVRMIRRSAEHLAGLIEGLLDISKIEAGRLNIYRNEFRFDEFLDQLADMFRIQAEAKGLELRFDRPQFLPEVVHSDEKRVRQILINLLSNAIKYTEKGHVAFDVRYQGQVAEFTIEDTGIGLRETNIDSIFDPFVRIHEPGIAAQPGTGLGLTITKLLTEVLGGEIKVESVFGQGSVFRVKLMIPSVHQPVPQREPQRIFGYHGRRLTVIVTDDDPAHRELIAEALMPLGFTVLAAADGAACLDLAAKMEPDLFILDISMPGMNGWDLAGHLREAGHRGTPIIMVSAVAHGELGEAPGPQYHDARITKPIQLNELLDRMGKLLKIEWIRDRVPDTPKASMEEVFRSGRQMKQSDIQELRELSRIGHARALEILLNELGQHHPELGPFLEELKTILARFDFDRLEAILDQVEHENAG